MQNPWVILDSYFFFLCPTSYPSASTAIPIFRTTFRFVQYWHCRPITSRPNCGNFLMSFPFCTVAGPPPHSLFSTQQPELRVRWCLLCSHPPQLPTSIGTNAYYDLKDACKRSCSWKLHLSRFRKISLVLTPLGPHWPWCYSSGTSGIYQGPLNLLFWLPELLLLGMATSFWSLLSGREHLANAFLTILFKKLSPPLHHYFLLYYPA